MIKYLILLIFFCGCYSQKKAKEQFNKAAIAYPDIPAEYCKDAFPVKDSTIRDTLTTTDTIYIEGAWSVDTVKVNDTVRITITKTLPGKVITNTVHITDTVIRENTAALKSCEIDKSKLTDLLVKKTAESDKYKGQAQKRGSWMWSLIALIVAVIGLNIYLRSKKIINAN